MLLAWGIRFFMAGALTGNQLLGGYAPFALGSIAAAGPGMGGLSALLGAAAGALLLMDFADALPFLATAVLIYAAASAFQGNKALSGPRVMSLMSAGLFFAVELIYVWDAAAPGQALTPCVAAAGLTGASAWYFWPLLHPAEDRPPSEGIVFLTASMLLAVQGVAVAGLSLGRTLLCVLLAYTSFVQGPAAGTAAGLSLGLAADLCGGGSGLLTAGLGFGSLLCGRYGGGRRHRAALCFLGGTLAVLLCTGDPMTEPLLIESGTGMLAFLLLPERLFGGKRVLSKPKNEAADRLRQRLNRTAAALRDLYENCGMTESRENPAVIFDRAAERVCRECPRCQQCWKAEYRSTFQALDALTPSLLDRGRIGEGEFPPVFASRCLHLNTFTAAVNAELSAFLLRRRYRRQLEEVRREARGQYAQLSELLSSAAASVEPAVPAFAAPSCRLGTALRPKRGERVCGDTLASFQTEEGLWCLLLADGMGSGELARRESDLTCRLLREFLEAGIHPEAALQTLNSAMALRGEETGSFTTVDLCTFDARSGEASFYKFGAAPSYLKRGTVVRRITGASLPVGLRPSPSAPDITRVRLEPGSFAVMVSDGVADPGEDGWLQALLSQWNGEEPQELAGAIMEESVRRQKARDDCGIQILYRPAAKLL